MTGAVVDDLIPSLRVNPTGQEIGRGAYGRVFEVNYDGTLCAAKEVHLLLQQYAQGDEFEKIRRDFLQECQIWSTLRHPSIVQFLVVLLKAIFSSTKTAAILPEQDIRVYYPTTNTIPVIVMEKMKCSLKNLIEMYNNIPLNVKLSILDEVCLGLRYLHTRNPPIVHRDLTPNNILLSCYIEAKITDLGVAKVMQTRTSRTMTKAPGTTDFMPPECLCDHPVYGLPLDIFSYGGVVLFTVTELWPQPTSWVQFDPETGDRNVLSEVQRRQRYLDRMNDSTTDLKPLVRSCLGDNPLRRPQVLEVSVTIRRGSESCSQMSGHDGKSIIAWLAEQESPSILNLQHQQITLMTTQLEEMRANYSELQRENDTLQDEIELLKTQQGNMKGPHRKVQIRWTEVAPAPVGHSAHTAVLLDGKVYIGGGDSSRRVPIYHIDTYNIAENVWSSPIVTHWCYFSLALLNNNLIVAGGRDHDKNVSRVMFKLKNNQLNRYNTMSKPRYRATAAAHQTILLMIGGINNHGKVLDLTELFDSTTGQWYDCEDLPRPHSWLKSIILNGSLYLLGGFDEYGKYSSKVFSTTLETLSNHQLKWKS